MSVMERRATSARRESLLGDEPGAFAVARFVRVTPMKARRVVDLVRGMGVDDALDTLKFAPQAAAATVHKVVSSAAANAESTEHLSRSDLVVAKAFVDEGPTLKRHRPRAQGRATRIDKRTSHITVVLQPRVEEQPAEADRIRASLEELTGKQVQLNILEVKNAEIDAQLVAQGVAEQLSGRVAFRRAMRKAMQTSMRGGAKGIRIQCSGRLGGAEMSRSEFYREGQVPLHTLRADIDYGFYEARTTFGRIGVKVWIYKGEAPQTRAEREAAAAALRAGQRPGRPPQGQRRPPGGRRGDRAGGPGQDRAEDASQEGQDPAAQAAVPAAASEEG